MDETDPKRDALAVGTFAALVSMSVVVLAAWSLGGSSGLVGEDPSTFARYLRSLVGWGSTVGLVLAAVGAAGALTTRAFDHERPSLWFPWPFHLAAAVGCFHALGVILDPAQHPMLAAASRWLTLWTPMAVLAGLAAVLFWLSEARIETKLLQWVAAVSATATLLLGGLGAAFPASITIFRTEDLPRLEAAFRSVGGLLTSDPTGIKIASVAFAAFGAIWFVTAPWLARKLTHTMIQLVAAAWIVVWLGCVALV